MLLPAAARRVGNNNVTEEASTAPLLRSAANDSCGNSDVDAPRYEAPSLQATATVEPYAYQNHTTSEAAAYFSLPSDMSASSPNLPISEIVSVVIRGVDGSNRLARPLTRRPDRLYVSFAHRGAHRGTSLPLNDRLEASFVNLPILDTDEARLEPVRCTIMRRRRFCPDEKLYTADVIFRHGRVWRDENGNGVVDEGEEFVERELTGTSVVRDMKGRDTGAKIELRLLSTEYIAASVEGNRVDKPPKIDVYYKLFTAALPLALSRFFVGNGTSTFSKPRG